MDYLLVAALFTGRKIRYLLVDGSEDLRRVRVPLQTEHRIVARWHKNSKACERSAAR